MRATSYPWDKRQVERADPKWPPW